jgi:RNA polymerase sigma-70 factor (family 1)
MRKKGDFTDLELVDQLSLGDEKAFEAIYQRYWYKLYQIAHHNIGSQMDAEQIVQDIFESLWLRRAELKIKELGIYLVVSIKNRAINFIKSQITLRKYQEYLIFQEIRQADSSESIVYFDDLLAALETALKQLPERTTEIFKKSRFENQSNKDIAREFNITEKAVEYHITKSLKYLRDQLQDFHKDN